MKFALVIKESHIVDESTLATLFNVSVFDKYIFLSLNNYRDLLAQYFLRLELRCYLIVFEPLSFVLDQWKHSWEMLLLSSVLHESKNVTMSH